jgi:hypothetical protein
LFLIDDNSSVVYAVSMDEKCADNPLVVKYQPI